MVINQEHCVTFVNVISLAFNSLECVKLLCACVYKKASCAIYDKPSDIHSTVHRTYDRSNRLKLIIAVKYV